MTTNAVELISAGKGLAEVIKSVAKEPEPLRRSDRPVKLPTKVVLTPEQIKAIRAFPKVVENGVTPETRRKLTSQEVALLLAERAVLDAVEAVIKARKEAQRTAVFNHYDVAVEEKDGSDAVEVTDDGWYVTKAGVAPDGSDRGFVRSVSEGSPSLSAPDLKALVGVPLDSDGTILSEEDYEACVAKIDVIDELRLLLRLRERPYLVEAIRRAVKVGRKTVTHRIGKVGS